MFKWTIWFGIVIDVCLMDQLVR